MRHEKFMKEEYVLKNILSNRLGSFENKTQLKEEIACEKLAFAGMEIDASKRLVYRGEKEVNITFTEFEISHLLARNPGMWRRFVCCQEKINKSQKMAYFRAFCEVSIIRGALRKARFSYMETYLL